MADSGDELVFEDFRFAALFDFFLERLIGGGEFGGALFDTGFEFGVSLAQCVFSAFAFNDAAELDPDLGHAVEHVVVAAHDGIGEEDERSNDFTAAEDGESHGACNGPGGELTEVRAGKGAGSLVHLHYDVGILFNALAEGIVRGRMRMPDRRAGGATVPKTGGAEGPTGLAADQLQHGLESCSFGIGIVGSFGDAL